jgi:uncharacterized membrane protein
MMWRYAPHAGLWLFPVMLLFWGVVIAAAVMVLRALGQPERRDGALDVLRRRLAAGEITPEEFETTRKLLQS